MHLTQAQQTKKEDLPSVRISPEEDEIRRVIYKGLGIDPVVITKVTDWLHEITTLESGTLLVRTHWEKERVCLFDFKKDVLNTLYKEELPVPEILLTGNTLIPFAYQVSRKMPGIYAHHYIQQYKKDCGDIWQRIGTILSRFHEIEASGYGRIRFWVSNDHLYSTWKGYVQSELKKLETTKRVLEENFIDIDLVEEAQDIISEMYTWNNPPRIVHGNINLNNVLVDRKGLVTGIVNWDHTYCGPAPYGDLVPISLWTHMSEKHRFLEGYGVMPDEWKEIMNALIPLQVFYLLNQLHWYAETGNAEGIDKVLWCMHEVM